MVTGAKLLRGFLDRRDISLSKAGEALQVSAPSVHAWLKGTARPKGYLRDALEVWSRGAVPAASWDTPQERRARREARPVEPDSGS